MQKKNKTKQIILFLSLVVIIPISNFLKNNLIFKNNTKPKQIILFLIIPSFLIVCMYYLTNHFQWILDWIVKSME